MMSTGEKIPFSRAVDSLICSAQWEIEPRYGQAQLSGYLSDLDALASGVPFESLGYSERRKNQMPELVEVSRFQNNGGGNGGGNGWSKKIQVLKLEGVMRTSDGMYTRGVDSLVRDLTQAEMNEEIGGVILRVNSGGGESLAGRLLQGAVSEFSKPILVLADFMASAAVRGTLPADFVWASSNAVEVGSLGTMVSINRSLVEYYRTGVEEIYGEQATDKNREWREYLAGNRMPLVESLTQANEEFLREARKWRGVSEEAMTGKMFMGEEGKRVGLVDRIGGFKEAVEFLSGVIWEREMESIGGISVGGFSNKIQNKSGMNFQEFVNKMAAQWSRITGRDHEEGVEVTAEKLLQEAESVEEMVARSEVERVNTLLEAERQRVEVLATENKELQGKVGELEKKVAELRLKANEMAPAIEQKEVGSVEIGGGVMDGFILIPQGGSKY